MYFRILNIIALALSGCSGGKVKLVHASTLRKAKRNSKLLAVYFTRVEEAPIHRKPSGWPLYIMERTSTICILPRGRKRAQ